MASWKRVKDAQDVLDYKFDFANATNGGNDSDWLASGETISTHTITAESGITIDSSSVTDTNTSVTVWASGGTAGESYDIACKITTSGGRTLERTLALVVRNL